MSKFSKILSALAAAILCVFALASCNNTNFYDEWYSAGATIEKENCFKILSVDDVKKKIDNNETFIFFIGSSTNSTAVSIVSQIQEQADYLNYEGVVYFVNIKDILTSTAKQKETKAALGVKEIDDGNGLVAACYKEGKLYFDTSNPNEFCDRFEIKGSSSVNFVALIAYVFEYYYAEK